MLSGSALQRTVAELAARPGHEKVRVHSYRLLVDGLGVQSHAIDFEKPVPEVHGRLDALLGRTVLEFKSDLRRERETAEHQLQRYIDEREGQTGKKYVGIATDGADFFAFFLRANKLVQTSSYHIDPAEPRDILVWFQSAIAIGHDLTPNRRTVVREFGRESLAAQRALDDLTILWERIGGSPEARLKRELWSTLLSVAYGADQVGDDRLFLQHSYLVVVAKSIAWGATIATPPKDAQALLHGTGFSDLGITGQNEPDFFDWVLAKSEGADLAMRVWGQVSRFNLDNIQIDILKALYESLIDPDTRHDLGEYYTPDWLAARVVNATIRNPLKERVMDPACGSGTFLFHAVRAVLDAATAGGLSAEEAVQRASDNVVGIDVHPVAVIFARVTYLLALMPTLKQGRPPDLAVPVHLGDSLQWNRTRVMGSQRQSDMFGVSDTLDIFVPAIRVRAPKPRRLGETTLRFPANVAQNIVVFDRVLDEMLRMGERTSPVTEFRAWIERDERVEQADRETLCQTYTVMRCLAEEGRNHIWGYVARNLARPAWLSSDARRADVLVGNPPWVSYRYMSTSFQVLFRSECRNSGVWVGGNVATQQDLSGYFYMRVALLYARPKARIALVMPYAAMSRQAYDGFRKGEILERGEVSSYLRFTDAWTFGPEVQPLFPVPSCVLFAQMCGESPHERLPTKVVAFAGALPRRDAGAAEAERCLTRRRMPWPTAATQSGSLYRDTFRNGATLWPRRLVLVEHAPLEGSIPPNPDVPLVRGRESNQDKKPWKSLPPPHGPIEKSFVCPVLLGESIVPFCVFSPRQAVIPWDAEKRELMDAHAAAERGFPRLADWLRTTEGAWNLHNRGRLSLIEQYDYYGKLTGQFPLARLRVVYTKSGTRPAAAVVQGSAAIIDHQLYWAPVRSVGEGRYLTGVLNSEPLRASVARYQAVGQWGARHFDKYVFNLPIPRYDPENGLHRALAAAAKRAEVITKDVAKEGEHFSRARRRVREILAERGVSARVDELAAKLLEI